MMTRTERQAESVQHWRKARGKGTIKGCTGYGKTKCAIDIIKSINSKRGYDILVGVIVPTNPLKTQWEKIIEREGIKNLAIYTIQSFNNITEPITQNFWIYDEIHLYLEGEVFGEVFNKTISEFKLGLTGTLTEEEEVKVNKLLPIIDTVTFEYAQQMGWVADLVEYNYMVQLSKEEIDSYSAFKEENKKRYSLFSYDADYMRMCQARTTNAHFQGRGESSPSLKPGAEWVARQLHPIVGKDGEIYEELEYLPEGVDTLKGKELFEFMHLTAKQLAQDFKAIKDMVNNFPSCIKAAKEVIEHIDRKTIVFGESNKAAESLHNILKDSGIYHSDIKTRIKAIVKEKSFKTQAGADRNADKLKGKAFMRGNEWIVSYPSVEKTVKEKIREELLEKLEKGEISTLVSSKCFVVGLDVYGLQVGVNLSTTRKHTTHEQKLGRPSRKEGDKEAIFVNIIPKDTNAIFSFKEAQVNSKGVRYITNVNQIELN